MPMLVNVLFFVRAYEALVYFGIGTIEPAVLELIDVESRPPSQ